MCSWLETSVFSFPWLSRMEFLKWNHLMVNSLVVSKVRVNISPKRFNHVMTATSNKVGINMPQGNWKVLVEPSQNKIDTNNMVGLYPRLVLDIYTMS